MGYMQDECDREAEGWGALVITIIVLFLWAVSVIGVVSLR